MLRQRRARTAGVSVHEGRAIQLYDTYLVLETPEGMLVIDQHALHERILFEQLKTRLREGRLETQRLLIPEPVDLPAEQAARVLEKAAELAELGLGVEDFGGGTVLLTSYPALLGSRSASCAAPGRGGSPDGKGPDAEPRAAVQRPAQPDGVSRGSSSRRPAVARGDWPRWWRSEPWRTTRITARTAGPRRCCSVAMTWSASSAESSPGGPGGRMRRPPLDLQGPAAVSTENLPSKKTRNGVKSRPGVARAAPLLSRRPPSFAGCPYGTSNGFIDRGSLPGAASPRRPAHHL